MLTLEANFAAGYITTRRVISTSYCAYSHREGSMMLKTTFRDDSKEVDTRHRWVMLLQEQVCNEPYCDFAQGCKSMQSTAWRGSLDPTTLIFLVREVTSPGHWWVRTMERFELPCSPSAPTIHRETQSWRFQMLLTSTFSSDFN